MTTMLDGQPAQKHPWWRSLSAGIAVAAVAVAGALIPTAPAAAAEGSAPTPIEYRVLETEHSDTIATFWDGGDFALGSKADVDGSLGVRFPADGVLVHVNDLARYDSWPAGYEFVSPAGSTVWLAPQTRADGVVWPGFSTESVPSGVLNGNITFTLDEVTGPGDVELWLTNAFGGVQERLWSSDEAVKSFARPINTHMHANWAFTQPGTYRLTVTASATTVGGAAVSDTQTYTFVAGPLPEVITTSTSLHVDGDSTVTAGTPVELHATVSPASVEGYVEFRDGATVLGHAEVSGGQAELEVAGLAIGAHSIAARFVPKVANFTTGSDSAAVAVTVTDAAGVEFGISGMRGSYQPGDALTATVVGYVLGEGTTQYGQQFRWLIRPVGSTAAGTNVQTSTAAGYSKTVDVADDGYELSVTARNCTNASCSSGTVAAQTPWVPIRVAAEGTAPVIATASGTPEAMYAGDTVRFEASGLNLADGETTQWVYRTPTSQWMDYGPDSVVLSTVRTESSLELTQKSFLVCATCSGEAVVRVMRDGAAVRQSEPIAYEQKQFELQTEGLQGLYFDGATMRLGGHLYPVRESDADLVYQWQLFASTTDMTLNRNAVIWGEGETPALERTASLADNNGYLRLVALKPGFTGQYGSIVARSETLRVYVTDDPDAQLFFLNAIAGHYHQGEIVDLKLTVEPAPAEGDQVVWEWKWPGADWTPLPSATGLSHPILAEQALHNVQVRAMLGFAAEGKESLVAAPVTILVDDHGAAARQMPTIGGQTSVTRGDTVTLTRELPVNGATVLTEHRWERKAAGASEFTAIAGQAGPTLTFTAGAEDDGAEYRVLLVTLAGTVAYGPSPTVTLVVSAPAATAPTAPAKPGISVDESTVVVSWVAPADGGSSITGYTVTLTGGAEPIVRSTAAGASSTTFTDLPSGTYSATVLAANEIGASDASPVSDPVTVTTSDPGPDPADPTVPSAPAKPGISVDGTTVVVSWVAPADGGSSITGYTVTLTGGAEPIVRSTAADASSATFTGLAAGVYAATVVAANAIGTSDASPASGAVTVAAPVPVPSPAPDDQLTDATRGDVQTSEAATPGGQITVTVPGHGGEQVRVWLHSTPVLLGTVTLNASGSALLTIPAGSPLGSHRVVVQAMGGAVIGWAPITLAEASRVGSGGRLASTGADVNLSLAAGGAALLMLLGAATILATRRRREEATASD